MFVVIDIYLVVYIFYEEFSFEYVMYRFCIEYNITVCKVNIGYVDMF